MGFMGMHFSDAKGVWYNISCQGCVVPNVKLDGSQLWCTLYPPSRYANKLWSKAMSTMSCGGTYTTDKDGYFLLVVQAVVSDSLLCGRIRFRLSVNFSSEPFRNVMIQLKVKTPKNAYGFSHPLTVPLHLVERLLAPVSKPSDPSQLVNTFFQRLIIWFTFAFVFH